MWLFQNYTSILISNQIPSRDNLLCVFRNNVTLSECLLVVEFQVPRCGPDDPFDDPDDVNGRPVSVNERAMKGKIFNPTKYTRPFISPFNHLHVLNGPGRRCCMETILVVVEGARFNQ